MQDSRRARSIAERVDDALAQAAEAGREPAAIVLGQDDYPAFQAWAREALGLEIEVGSTYRDVIVRRQKSIFLSRLELRSKPGAPNALLL